MPVTSKALILWIKKAAILVLGIFVLIMDITPEK